MSVYYVSGCGLSTRDAVVSRTVGQWKAQEGWEKERNYFGERVEDIRCQGTYMWKGKENTYILNSV